ncbi:MAG TPA: FHA domain-containing protein [Thermoanaerobaculia bacterium]|nr:FHA domain-containing protein [Thermoanaerobaculia bacterium]
MPAKLTLFPPQGVARSFVFREGRNHFAGRDPGSDIYLQDPRVSSRHALFQWTGSAGGWNLVDLRSKNGTFVNGSRITDVPLQDADWMSFGGLLAFFERLSAAQVQEYDGECAARLDAAAAARLALVPNVDPRATLRGLLASARELLGAERGLLLLLDAAGGLHVAFASGFARYEPLDEAFETGLTALRQTLETRRPIAALDHRSHSAQGKRRSLTDLGRGAIACVPLSIPPWPRGLLAVDVRKEGGAFTELDLEILGAFADHAAVALAGAPLSGPVREIDGSPLPEGAAEERHILAQLERKVAGWVARESRPHRLTPIG